VENSEVPNYMTPQGFNFLNQELEYLIKKARPEVVSIVSWAASNGDRSENGDYIYGKKRLREIDRRLRFLKKRLDVVQVVDNTHRETDQIFFGATVEVFYMESEVSHRLTIVGMDEIDMDRGYISWCSPLAKALLKRKEGDMIEVHTPEGIKPVEILLVEYIPVTFTASFA
jgi:transcription elongation factor GreB